jgi:signal peptidase I
MAMKDNAPGSVPPPWWLRILIGRHPRRTLLRGLVLGLLCWFWFTQVWLPIRIFGISMEPAFHDGQVRLLNAWAYRWKKPHRGDVVSIMMVDRHALLLKRIIGLPGERISISGGIVYINGQPLDEPYVKKNRAPWFRSEVLLKPDEYLVIGDNREMARRDHVEGEVPAERILGRVLF